MLKQKIEELIREKNENARELDRDIQILLEYFGFGEDRFPTEDTIGFKHRNALKRKNKVSDNVDETDFTTLSEEKKKSYRANVSLILKQRFKGKVKINDIPTLQEIEKILCECNYVFYSDFLLTLIERDLLDDVISLKGLINLLNCFSLERNFGIYGLDMLPANKEYFVKNDDTSFIIVNDDVKDELRSNIQKVLKIPSHVGICCLDAVYKGNDGFQFSYPEMKNILRNMDDVWSKDIDNKFWFLVQDRTNPIINSLGKIKNVGNVFEKEILPSVVINNLGGHSDKFIRKNRPTSTDEELNGIVKGYLDNSKYVTTSEKYYVLKENLPLERLTPIEDDLCSFFQDKKESRYGELLKYLQARNSERQEPYSESNLKKNCYHSSLLYKKRVLVSSRQGEIFNFIFIKCYSNDTTPIVDRYQLFRNKLLDLNGHTDIEGVQKTRAEQKTLHDWLFENKVYEVCALCGKEYSINSLVAAHKKKRKNCSTNEKTDPYIVMPVCKFGCDQVYENRWIKIVNGWVQDNSGTVRITKNEKEYIDILRGRSIEERWLRGDPVYFNDV